MKNKKLWIPLIGVITILLLIVVVLSCKLISVTSKESNEENPTESFEIYGEGNNSIIETPTPSSIGTHTHTYSSWTTVKEPTCTSEGTKMRNCVCGDIERQSLNMIPCEEENGICKMCYRPLTPFNILKNHIVTNGSKLTSGYEYLYTDENYINITGCRSYIEYNANTNEITIGVLIEVEEQSIFVTNVINTGSTTQKIQMQYQEDGRYHYCSANITTSFSDTNNTMSSAVYRSEISGIESELQDDMFELMNQSTHIMLIAVSTTIRDFNLGISLSDFGYVNYN